MRLLVAGAALALTLGGTVTSSCSGGCTDKINCTDVSVSVAAGVIAEARETKICVDGTCETSALGTADFGHFALADWEPGRRLDVEITVFDRDGNVIASVSDAPRMFETEETCRCAAIGYVVKDGKLVRQV